MSQLVAPHGSTRGRRTRLTASVILALSTLLIAAFAFAAQSVAAANPEAVFGPNSSHRGGSSLDGATTSGAVYVWVVDVPSRSSVDFWLDAAAGSRPPDATDKTSPYDLIVDSRGKALPLDTEKLLDGLHALTIQVSQSGRVLSTKTANFKVDNAGRSSVSTLFGNAVPLVQSDPDTQSTELGMRFRPSIDGVITAIRFYKSRENTGIHVGSLWTSTGERIASVTFTSETASGWQIATLARPVALVAGQTYVASYNAPNGRYAGDTGYFARAKDSGPLHAFADGDGGPNGVYAYGPAGSFPTQSWNSSNYWVDVSFMAGSSSSVIPTTTIAPASDPATIVSTTAPAPTLATPPTTVPQLTTTTLRPTTTTTTTPPAPAPAPVPAPTPAPAPAPAPAGGFPNASNTGVPAGTVLRPSGDMVVTTPGAVIDAMDIAGTLEIRASNVTVMRSRIRGSGYSIVRVADNVTGVVLQDVEIDGLGTAGTGNSGGVIGPATVRRANIHSVENGVVPGSGSLIEDSWIHDLGAPGSPHYDGVQMDGGLSDIVVRHNSISVPDQTSAVMIDNYFGPIANITVDGNLLAGGTYTVYSDGQFGGGPIIGVRIINNRFGWNQFGYILVRNNSLAAFSGNVDDRTGQPISA